MANRQATLTDILSRREERAKIQRYFNRTYQCPLISLTVVTPGAFKDTEQTRYLFRIAKRALLSLCCIRHWQIIEKYEIRSVTGSELIYAVNTDEIILKKSLITLEDEHILGRLWDIDVIDKNGMPLSREQFHLPERRCLICEKSAFICSRSQAHSLTELEYAITHRINLFNAQYRQ